MKFVAFTPEGVMIPDGILDMVLSQAGRGLVTDAAKGLKLIPDTRRGRPDASGMVEMGRVRNKDCMTVLEYARKIAKTTEGRRNKAKNANVTG